jgi:flagellin-like protein
MRKEKRGISPVIATVFMILLVVSLSALVFIWARGFVEERENEGGLTVDELCEAVNFDIDNVSGNSNFEIINRGDINISSLQFRVYYGGDSSVLNWSSSVVSGEARGATIDLSSFSGISSVEVIPVLDGGLAGLPEDILCEDDGVFMKGV